MIGEAKDQIPILVRQFDIGILVCDYSPLRISIEWTEQLCKNLPKNILICQVDVHNIFPVWIVSQEREESPHTIRPKLNALIETYLTEFPPLIKHPITHNNLQIVQQSNNNNETELKLIENLDDVYPILECDRKVKEVKWARPGYTAAIQVLEDFIYDRNRLRLYDKLKNDPNQNGQSQLSPWLHFGQIAPQRCILEVSKYLQEYGEAVQWFYEMIVVMRELADNFCAYEKNYDNLMGNF